jgi:polysaccharide export outer membrane protein
MVLLRLPALALAAALLSACGVSSVSDYGSTSRQLDTSPAKTVAQTSPALPPQDAVAQKDAALQKISVSLKAVADPSSKTYKIGPLDVIEITVFKVPDLSKVVQVSEAGTINYPLIGEVEASGKSARELEQFLTKSLGAKYLQKPQISVFVKEHNSQRITIDGAVKKPGIYPIAGGMTLVQAIAQAQGFEQTATETVVLFRQSNGKQSAAKFDVSDIRAGRAEDPQLQAGDVIVASTSDFKEGFNTFLRLAPLATLVPLL